MKAWLFLLVLVTASCVHPIRQAAFPALPAFHAAPVAEADDGRKFFLLQRLPAGMTELPVDALEPGLLAPSAFTVGGKQYVAAFNSDGSYTLPTTSTLGLNSRPAKPGETIVIYGVGFGPAAPTGGPQIAPGVIVTKANQLTDSMKMAIGGTNATLSYEGLAPNYIGLYQFNVVVPASLANSDTAPLTFNVGGDTGSETLYTAVHN